MSGRPQAVLFDWDNTLVDTWPAIHDANNHTLVAFGMAPWTLEETRRRVRKSMREAFPPLFGARWEEAGEVFYRRFAEIHLDRLAPCPGAAEMLVALRGAGLYLGVVSNKKGPFLRKEAAALRWDGYFGRLVGAADAGRDKPAFEPVDLALEGSALRRGRAVWFAGDTDIDLECAHRSGCVPVLVRPEPPAEGEFPDFPPELWFPTCEALSKHVTTL